MTTDDIIRSHLMLHPDTPMDKDEYVFSLREIKQAVEAAVKVEREACAALCFQMWNKWLDSSAGDDFLDTSNCPDAEDCAAAIRARGQE